MMEKRLIDANALMDAMRDEEFQTFVPLDEIDSVIDKAPTIDAVEVVRCRECIYKDIPKCCPYQINGFEVVSNWYCPMGVRKMDAKEEDHAE